MHIFLILDTRKSPIQNYTLSTTATMQNARLVLKQKESFFRFGCTYVCQDLKTKVFRLFMYVTPLQKEL